MARKCMARRQFKREKLAKKYETKIKELRAKQTHPDTTPEEMMSILHEFSKLPSDASKTRSRNRCFITGRGNGVYRIVGVCRNKFRELCMAGYLPGLSKSSW